MNYAIEVKGKKPKLKFDILDCLALIGRLSKSGLKNALKDRYYADISHSVDELNKGGHIKVAKKERGSGKKQVYFTITEKGLKALLADYDFPALRFWEIVHGYCQNNDELVTLEKIDEFYKIVIERYLKYPNRGFSSLLGIFHDVCNNWLQEAIIKSNEITTVQKILEILAINPRIMSERLDELIDKALEGTRGLDSYVERDDITDIIVRYIRVQNSDDAKETYESSLFGIMLCLVLIHYNNTGRLKNGMYFKKFSVEEYYDRIASNYKMKLPLIFGKWNYLKRVQKGLAICNFNMILDEIISSEQNSQSVVLGGNKEFCDGIRTILLYNAMLMIDFAVAGQEFLDKTIQHLSDSSEFEKNEPLRAKLKELKMLLNHIPYTFPNDSNIYRKLDKLYPSKNMLRSLHRVEISKKMEESFAEEITALYYMNMISGITICANNLRDYSELSDHASKEYLSLILQQDKKIREWFSRWMNDLVSLQEDICKVLKSG